MFPHKNLAVCLAVLLMATTLMFAPAAEAGVVKNCYETWSRCSRWSSGLTGILWKSCPDRCRQLGHRGGKCVPVKSNCPVSNTALQCQCH